MCPVCITVAGIVAAVFRPWRARRRQLAEQSASAWRPDRPLS